MVHPEQDLASNCIRNFVIDLGELHKYLKTEITEAQKRFQKYTDTWYIPLPDFTLGEQAYIKEHYFCTQRPIKKLAEKYLSLYKLIMQVESHSFTLRLSRHHNQYI